MKTLRITTHWTTEEADCIYQFLDECKSAVWDHYGEEISRMHKAIWDEQQDQLGQHLLNDELPF